MASIDEQEFVIFDVETTGLSPSDGDRVVEVAALKVKNLKPIDRFHTLIDPQRPVSFGAFQVNGISQEMLKDAPQSKEAIPQLMKFIGNSCLVGHNVKFDLSFLNNELDLIGFALEHDIVALDTINMARMFLPELGRYPLWFVSQSLGIDTEQEHRAMSDVELTFKVFHHLISMAQRRDIADIRTLVNLFGYPKSTHALDEQRVQTIKETIDGNGHLQMLYFSASNASTSSRKVTPKRLKGQGRNMMMIGFCHLRGEDRSFRVDRILNLESCATKE